MKTKKITRNAALFSAALTLVFMLSSCQKEKGSILEKEVQMGEVVDIKSTYIKGKYIVTLNEKTCQLPISRRSANPESYRELVFATSLDILKDVSVTTQPEYVYSNTISGFAVEMTEEQANRLKSDLRVSHIEQDQEIHLGILNKGKRPNDGGGTEEPPTTSTQVIPYGIKRLKSPSTPYAGTGIVFIIDTGIEETHPDLNVSTSKGFTAFTKGKDASFTDYNGHGTHVAGTIGAINNNIGVIGVAPGVVLVPIKVLDSRGSGSMGGVIAGVDHVAKVASSGDVANMSLGGGASSTLDNAVINLASKGVKVVIAAGNSKDDANKYSPARVVHPNTYTISAMDINDNFAVGFSNYGNPPIRYCAPGVNVYSTWIGKTYNTISGTSMAAPHIAGALLYTTSRDDGFVKNDPDQSPDPILVVQ